MIALIAALAVAAPSTLAESRGPAGEPATCKAQGVLQTSQPMHPALLYRSDGTLRASRLGDLPEADHEKAVLRTIGGCAAPLYIGYSVGR